ncbi:hypothetical protein [Sphingomonas sp. PB4P5]|uniref:hypothetical protein n=1 Tax=Parasphingomonas puruogangriensis TaxID=3096155 RepID=UPI002FCC6C63
MKKWGEDRFQKLQQSRADMVAKRAALAGQLHLTAQQQAELKAAEAAQARRFADIDIGAALAFAATIKLRRFDMTFEGDAVLNRPTLALMRHFLEAIVEQRSAAALQWPMAQRDASILHPLTMLAMLGSRPAIVGDGHRWCAPVPDMRTLYYPHRGGGTGSDHRGWLVDRANILGPNALHRTRGRARQQEASNVMGQLHDTLGHLSLLKLRDEAMPHLAHPTLGELFPVFAADGGVDARAMFAGARHELFGRVRHGAAIDKLGDHRAALTDPCQAPFALFGIDARANLKAALNHPALTAAKGGRPPDLCLLDLGQPALNRLGPVWEETVTRFLETLLDQFPQLPILAVTHDAYVQRRLAHLFRQSKAARLAERSALPVPAIIRRTADICTPDPPIEPVTSISAIFQSMAGASVTALSALAEAARAMPDAVSAGAIRRSAANLRRAAALPCGLRAAYDGLCDLEGQAAAEAFLEQRSEASVLDPVQTAMATGIAGTPRTKLLAAEAAIAKAYAQLDTDTPIGSAVAELAAGFARKVDFSIVVFASAIDLRLAERRFAEDPAVADGLRKRIASGKLKICHAGNLDSILAEIEAGPDRNSWKRLALLAPPISFLDTVLVRPWLPEQLLVICDRAFTGRVAGTYAPLARHADFASGTNIGGRMAVLAAAAKKEGEARAVAGVNLVLDEQPVIDVADKVIDLTDGDTPSGDTLEIELASGRSLRVRPGASMIRHMRDAPINPFDRTTASQLLAANVIVVTDRAFVDAARRVLPVELLARNWVKLYHDMIVAMLPAVAGGTLQAKARTVHALLQKRHVQATSVAAVVDWLNAETYLAQPAEQMRPHAPRVRGDFDALLAVLNIPPGLADKMWDEGIEQLRSDRRRAGIRMAQAFISVLVDPHGVAAGLNQDVRAGIAALRARALDHLDVVRAVKRENGHDR